MAFHVAGAYDVGPVDEARLERVNVTGTAAFIDAVRAARPARAIHVSTAAVYGPLEPGAPAPTEASPLSGAPRSVYQRTKIEAHRLALAAQADGLPLLIACPTFVYGPRDEGPAGMLVRDVVRGRLPAIPSDTAEFSFVYVDDVAEALARIGTLEGLTGTYLLGADAARLAGFIRLVALEAGCSPPRLRLPTAMVRLTGRALDVVSRLTGARFAISGEGVDMTTDGSWVVSSERARRDLDWRPRPLSDGVPPTVADAMAGSERGATG